MFIATINNNKPTQEYINFIDKALAKTGIDSDDFEGYTELM